MEVNAASCHSKCEVNQITAEKAIKTLNNKKALKAIETLASGAMKG